MARWIGIGTAALVVALAMSLPVLAKKPVSDPSEETTQQISGNEKPAVNADPNRLIEIMIELAWLADPVTFPYFLGARVEGSALHVRGFIANQSARDRALKLAKLHCPMTVIDESVIPPGFSGPAQPARISAGQLEKTGSATLHAFFPEHHFQVKADAAGRIRVLGQVSSFGEKLAVSQELRRMHGCTAVINMVHIVETMQAPQSPASIPRHESTSAKTPAMPDKPKPTSIMAMKPEPTKPDRAVPEKSGVTGSYSFPLGVVGVKNKPVESQPTKAPALQPVKAPALDFVHEQPKKKSEVQAVKAASVSDEPSSAPRVTYGTVLVREEPGPHTPTMQLRNQIVASCGIPEQNLQVDLKTASDVEIRIQARDQDEANAFAQRIFQLPELLSYQVDVQVTIPR